MAALGHPKWGGRRAGTPNKVNLETRNRIQSEADPIGFLIKVVNGRKMKGEYPTLTQRVRAAEKLLSKVVPDLKAVELSLETAVEPAMGDEARMKLNRLLDTKIQYGVLECLKRVGLTEEQALAAMKNQQQNCAASIGLIERGKE